MSCVIELADKRETSKAPKQVPHHAGVILFFEKKPETVSDDTADERIKLFRRTRPSIDTQADTAPGSPLLDLTEPY